VELLIIGTVLLFFILLLPDDLDDDFPDSTTPPAEAPQPNAKGWSRAFVQRMVKRILGPIGRTAILHGQARPCAIIMEKGGARVVLARGRTWMEAFDLCFLAPGRAKEKAKEAGEPGV
jgi:hypothetical protein